MTGVATSGPTINLCLVPKGFKPKLVYYQCEALSISDLGLNVRIGDAGDGVLTADDDRLMADQDSDVAATFDCLRVERNCQINIASKADFPGPLQAHIAIRWSPRSHA